MVHYSPQLSLANYLVILERTLQEIIATWSGLSKSNHIDLLLPITMASLYTGSRHNPPNPTDRKKSMSCIYFKGQHSPSTCDVVTDQQEHTTIVKCEKFCYNL